MLTLSEKAAARRAARLEEALNMQKERRDKVFISLSKQQPTPKAPAQQIPEARSHKWSAEDLALIDWFRSYTVEYIDGLPATNHKFKSIVAEGPRSPHAWLLRDALRGLRLELDRRTVVQPATEVKQGWSKQESELSIGSRRMSACCHAARLP